jgi:hypothetical protein
VTASFSRIIQRSVGAAHHRIQPFGEVVIWL